MSISSPHGRSRADTPDVDPSDALETDLSELTVTGIDADPIDDSHPATPSAMPGNEDEELQSFRERWKEDLRAKRSVPISAMAGRERDDSTHRAGPSRGDTVPAKIEVIEQNIPREAGTVRPAKSPKATVKPVVSPKASIRAMPEDLDEDAVSVPGPSSHRPAPVPATGPEALPTGHVENPNRREQAVSLYSRAVEHEQSGKLNEALMLYRRAFKLDDNVDRLYARSLTKAAQLATAAAATAEPLPASSTDIVSSAPPADEPYSFQRHIQLQPDYEKAHPPAHAAGPSASNHLAGPATASLRQSPLSTLLSRLPVPADQIAFLPADESFPLPLAKLPLELLDPILANMDIATIERFALTCWRARYVTSRAPVWRKLVNAIYRPPAVLPEGRSMRDLDVQGRYGGEWRTALMEEERVRMDGCYISVCHYIRPGAGDQWVTITHMITYHRFLRFYPDGSVISFLTTDHPSEVVPLLRPSLRGKGLHFGRWRLIRSDSPENAPASGTEPDVKSKVGTSVKRRARIVITDLLEPGAETPKYEFEMELALRETGRGRWNKLDISSYQSINLSTGESLALSLKHQKPFYFSKVKSYHPQL